MMKSLMFVLTLWMTVTGCNRFTAASREEATPPDYIKVTAVGTAEGEAAAPVDSFAAILNGPLEARATAPQDGNIADPTQRALMARAEARRTALRMLAQTLMRAKDGDGHTLAQVVKQSPERQNALANLLDAKATVSFEDREQKAFAVASIDGAQVLGLLKEKGGAGKAAAPVAASPEEQEKLKTQAQDKALDEAKKKLREQLLATNLKSGKTIGQVVADSKSAARELDALLFLVRPDEVNILEDGSCEVTIYFDRNRAIDAIENGRKKWWQPWKR